MLTYASAPGSVPPAFAAAHDRFWERLARPGRAWTSAQRVSIAAESRYAAKCRLCAERKAALSPGHVNGTHDSLGELTADAVEAVHGIANDAARLTRSWFDARAAGGLSAGAYVELLGTVVAMRCIDQFCRGLGLEPHALPEPGPGEPGREWPDATPTSAFVPMVAPEDAVGELADLYEGLAFVPTVVQALSLVPEEVFTTRDLSAAHYLSLKDVIDPAASAGPLSRPQMELVAARVSALNECFY